MRRRRTEKGRRGALSVDQEMELTIGPSREVDLAEDAQLRAVYFSHRDELLSRGPAGFRPWGWWRWESGNDGPPPVLTDRHGYVIAGSDAEETWLRKHGHLTLFEERELRKRRRLREASAS